MEVGTSTFGMQYNKGFGRFYMKTIVDDAGRIQLPENVRAQLGVKPGDEILLEAHAGEWILKSANSATGLLLEGNVLVHRGTCTSNATIEELLDDVRNDRFRDLAEGLGK